VNPEPSIQNAEKEEKAAAKEVEKRAKSDANPMHSTP
jgi:hypothetical protein